MIRAVVLLLFVGTICNSAAADAASTPVQHGMLRFVDRSRLAHFSDGTSGPRVLMTEVRYPRRGHAPFPLIVFAHGFVERPDAYARMLDGWAGAGYVVAAPAFPIERPDAPGGPSRNDLANEPGDLSYVITRMTTSIAPIRTLVDSRRIAVAGQSDGGVAALAVAYDRRFRDRRIDAAIVLSGAALPGFAESPPGSPPLLAVQGTQDPFNPPSATAYYFQRMRRPKFLLWLRGAPHLEAYTTNDRWAPVVRLATTRFLNHYLRAAPLRPLINAGTGPGVAQVVSEP